MDSNYKSLESQLTYLYYHLGLIEYLESVNDGRYDKAQHFKIKQDIKCVEHQLTELSCKKKVNGSQPI